VWAQEQYADTLMRRMITGRSRDAKEGDELYILPFGTSANILSRSARSKGGRQEEQEGEEELKYVFKRSWYFAVDGSTARSERLAIECRVDDGEIFE
jgi:hypothetical protein